jgi:type IX secretion system substrate protein
MFKDYFMRMHYKLIYLIAVLIFAIGGQASAIEYFVETGGSNSNDGLSRTAPLATIAAAVAKPSPTVINVTMTNSTDEFSNEEVTVNALAVNIVGTTDAMAGLGAGFYPKMNGNGLFDFAFKFDNEAITLENFTIYGYTNGSDHSNGQGTAIYISEGTEGHTISNIKIDYCGWGIYARNTSGTTIKKCMIGMVHAIFTDASQNGGVGIALIGTDSTLFLTDNTIGGSVTDKNYIYNCDLNGVQIGMATDTLDADNTIISYNEFKNCATENHGSKNIGAILIRGELTGIYDVSYNYISKCGLPLRIETGSHTDFNFHHNIIDSTSNGHDFEVITDTTFSGNKLANMIAYGNNTFDRGLSALGISSSNLIDYEVGISDFGDLRIIRGSTASVLNQDIGIGNPGGIIIFPGEHYETLNLEGPKLEIFGYGATQSIILGSSHDIEVDTLWIAHLGFDQDGNSGDMFFFVDTGQLLRIIFHECHIDLDVASTTIFEFDPFVSLKDFRVELSQLNGGSGLGNMLFNSEAPLLIEEMDIDECVINDLPSRFVQYAPFENMDFDDNIFNNGEYLVKFEFEDSVPPPLNFDFEGNTVNGTFQDGIIIDTVSDFFEERLDFIEVSFNNFNATFTGDIFVYHGSAMTDSSGFMDFRYNYWGDSNGPYWPMYNEVNTDASDNSIHSDVVSYVAQISPWFLDSTRTITYAPITFSYELAMLGGIEFDDRVFSFPGLRATSEISGTYFYYDMISDGFFPGFEFFPFFQVESRTYYPYNGDLPIVNNYDYEFIPLIFRANGDVLVEGSLTMVNAELVLFNEDSLSNVQYIFNQGGVSLEKSQIYLDYSDIVADNYAVQSDSSGLDTERFGKIIQRTDDGGNYFFPSHHDYDAELYLILGLLGTPNDYEFRLGTQEMRKSRIFLNPELAAINKYDELHNVGNVWDLENPDNYTDQLAMLFSIGIENHMGSLFALNTPETYAAYWDSGQWNRADGSASFDEIYVEPVDYHRYWTIFSGGDFAMENDPDDQAHSIQFTTVSSNTIGLTWVNGDGDNVIVFAKESSSTTFPVDGDSLVGTANMDYSIAGIHSGDTDVKILYAGPANINSLTTTGLEPGHEYTFGVAAYNGSGGTRMNFNSDTETNNPRTRATRPSASITAIDPEVCTGSNLEFEVTFYSTNTGSYNYRIIYNDGYISYLDQSNSSNPFDIQFIPHASSSQVNLTYARDLARKLCIIDNGNESYIQHPLPVVTFESTTSEFCTTSPIFELNSHGSPSGGDFSGIGVSEPTVGNFEFDPFAATVGNHTLTYSYTDGNGCVNSATELFVVTNPPVVTLSLTTTDACVDDASFALSGGSPVSGDYSGNGVSANMFDPSIVGVGTHTITYAYTDGGGCVNSATEELVVHALPVVTFSFNVSEACQIVDGLPLVGLNANVSPPGGEYSGGNYVAFIGPALDVNTPGEFVVTYTYTDGNGCVNSATDNFVVHPLPVVTFSLADTEYCVDETSVTLSGGSPVGGEYAGTAVSSGIFDPSSAGVGIHTITYSYTNPNGCINSATDEVVVHALPVVTLDITTTEICAYGGVLYLDGNSPGTNGTWSGDGIIETGFSPTTAGAGTHTITWTHTDANGCVNSATDAMTVHALPVVTLTFTTSEYCVDVAQFTLTGGSPVGGTYSGTGTVGGTDFDPGSAVIGRNSITYMYTDANGCTSSAHADIVVNALPTVTLSFATTEYCVDETSVTLSGGSPLGGEYAGTAVNTGIFNPSSAGVGTHSITYTYTDGNGCVNSATDEVEVHALPVVNIANAWQRYCNSGWYPFNFGSNLQPAGGVLSGDNVVINGVDGFIFRANEASIGMHILTYSYTDPTTGCVNSDTVQARVYLTPTANLTLTQTEFCVDDPDYTLAGGDAPPSAADEDYYILPGLTPSTTFSPSTLGPGTYSIMYNYLDTNGCWAHWAYDTIYVHPLPIVEIALATTDYCVDETAVDLTVDGTPEGGVFLGTAVSAGIFNPSSAGLGNHIITYSYTDANGCINSDTEEVAVHALPVVEFDVADHSYCQGTSTLFRYVHELVPAGGVMSGDGVVVHDATTYKFVPSNVSLGMHVLTYTFTDANGCVNFDTLQAWVYPQPEAILDEPKTHFCVNDPIYTFSGGNAPPSATAEDYYNVSTGWTETDTFNPATLGPGTYRIAYNFLDEDGCWSHWAYDTLYVHALPTISLAAMSTDYCIDQTAETLAGATPEGGEYSGTAISGGIFNPSSAGLGSHTITYSFTDEYGCQNSATEEVVVNSLPNVYFNNTWNNYCQGPIQYPFNFGNQLNPSGGVLSGDGVTSNGATGFYFTPNFTTPGMHVLTYTFTDESGCVSHDTLQAQVYPQPSATLTLTQTEFCVDDPDYTLAGGDASPSATVEYYYISPDTSPASVFSPSTLGPGTYQIRYTYQEETTCYSNWAYDTIVVHPLPLVSLGLLKDNACSQGDPFVIFGGSPLGGSYSGTGVSTIYFDPQTAGLGDHVLTYSFTDANGCVNSATDIMTVTANPTVSLALAVTEVCLDEDPFALSTGLPPGGSFSGSGVNSNMFTAANAGVGTHTITYTFTDENSCESSATDELLVNDLPAVSLNLVNTEACQFDGNYVMDGGSPAGGVYSGDDVSYSSPDYYITSTVAGSLAITYTYTDGNGCVNSATDIFVVHPKPIVTLDFPVTEFCEDADSIFIKNASPLGGIYRVHDDIGSYTVSGDSILISDYIPEAGMITISYTFTAETGCTTRVDQVLYVNPTPEVTLSLTQTDFCIDDGPQLLTDGSPSGGVYSGDYIGFGTYFEPFNAGVGSHLITYTFTDANGCSASATDMVVVNAKPVVTLSLSETDFCYYGSSVVFADGSPSGGVYTGFGMVNDDTFNPSTAGVGTHTITYSFTDANGCEDSATDELVVNPPPTVALNLATTEFCADDAEVVLAGGSPTGGTYYIDGTPSGTFDPSSVIIGHHSISYSITDVHGCTNITSASVYVRALPSVSFVESTTEYCVDDSPITLTAGSPAGGIYSGNGVNSLIDEFDPAAAGLGLHTLTYTYTDENGCVNSAVENIRVHQLPTVAFVESVTEFCVDDDPYTLTGGSPAGSSSHYSGNGVFDGVFTPSSVGVGTHTLTYTFTDANGCVNSATDEVTVYALPSVSLTLTTSEACLDADPVSLAGGSPTGGDFSGNGVSAGSIYPSIAGVGTHVITYTYTDANGCVNTATDEFNVIPLPSIAITPSPDAAICEGDSVLLSAAIGGSYSYSWYMDGTLIPGANAQTYWASTEGNYSCLILDNTTGCSVTTNSTFVYEVGGVPAQVGQPTASSVLVTEFIVNWTSVTFAEGYKLTVATDASFTSIVGSYNGLDVGNVLSYSISGLTQNVVYYAKVLAYSSCGEGNYSAVLDQRTKNPTITIATSSTLDFGDVTENTCSESQMFNFQASELVSSLLITPPVGMELSTDGINFNYNNTTPLILVPAASGTIGNTVLHARFCPTDRSAFSGSITLASVYASGSVSAIGQGIAAPPTILTSCISVSGTMDATMLSLSWTLGNGEGRLLVYSTNGSPVSWTPTEGSVPSNGSLDANHNVLVLGAATGSVLSVSANSVYWFKIYDYNGDGRYLTSGFDANYCCNSGVGNPAQPLYMDVVVNEGDNVLSGSNFDIDLKLVDRAGSAVTALSSVSGSLTTVPIGFVGSTAFTIPTGSNSVELTRSVTNAAGQVGASVSATPTCSTTVQSDTSPTFAVQVSAPTAQAKYVTFTGAGSNCEDDIWVNYRFRRASVPGLGVIVVARIGAKPEAPVAGVDYSASSNWLSGSTYGTGNSNHVVHLGAYTTNTVNVIYNIPEADENKILWVHAYEYNGSNYQTRGYNVLNGSVNPRATNLPAYDCDGGGDGDEEPPPPARDGDKLTSVKIAFFGAKSSDAKVFTNWTTHIENDLAGFEIFRARVEGFQDESDFVKVSDYLSSSELVASMSSSGADYAFVDSDPSLIVGEEYIYKLKYISIDGKSHIGDEAIVTVLDGGSASSIMSINNLTPQPASEFVRFDLNLMSEHSVSVEVLDLSGKTVIVHDKQTTYGKGRNEINIPLKELASGTYFLSVKSGSESLVKKFVVKR